MPQVFDERGNELRLGQELGRGGEGTVFAVSGTRLVAKLYSNPVPREKAEKLAVMAQAKAELRQFAAWPSAVLRDRTGIVVGFTMPLVPAESKEIHRLYSPKSRRADFPAASFRFLVRAGANIARAFASVHANGHVIGDVNHGNVLVSPNATVTLIDCDSYQITANGKRYLCGVGVPTYTPPELQSATFAGVVRTENHDCFGLAVLIFHLLFMGRHPFAGRYMGNDDMPPERAIQEFRFAFSARQRRTRMLPPPHTVSLPELSPSIASLFEMAFAPDSVSGGRPTAAMWVANLEALEKDTLQCAANHGHYYPGHLTSCLWCRIETATKVRMFGIGVAVGPGVSGFDLESVWEAIVAVQPPETQATIPNPNQFRGQVKRSASSLLVRRQRLTYNVGGIAILIVAIIVVYAMQPHPVFALAMLCGAIFNCVRSHRKSQSLAAHLSIDLAVAKAEYDGLVRKWTEDTPEVRFAKARSELAAARTAYAGLGKERLKRLQQLEKDKYKRQYRRWLESHPLENALIPGVGEGRKDLLASFGIEDAFDVTQAAIANVPGFTQALTDRVLAWRQELERQFKFNASEPTNPADVTAVEQDIAAKKVMLERTLSGGAAHLQRVREIMLSTRRAMIPQIVRAALGVAQARSELSLW